MVMNPFNLDDEDEDAAVGGQQPSSPGAPPPPPQAVQTPPAPPPVPPPPPGYQPPGGQQQPPAGGGGSSTGGATYQTTQAPPPPPPPPPQVQPPTTMQAAGAAPPPPPSGGAVAGARPSGAPPVGHLLGLTHQQLVDMGHADQPWVDPNLQTYTPEQLAQQGQQARSQIPGANAYPWQWNNQTNAYEAAPGYTMQTDPATGRNRYFDEETGEEWQPPGFNVWGPPDPETGERELTPWDGRTDAGGNGANPDNWLSDPGDTPIATSDPSGGGPPINSGGGPNNQPGTTPVGGSDPSEIDAILDQLLGGGAAGPGGIQPPAPGGDIDLDFADDFEYQPSPGSTSTPTVAPPRFDTEQWRALFDQGVDRINREIDEGYETGGRRLTERMAARGTLGSTIENQEYKDLVRQLEGDRSGKLLDLQREQVQFGFQAAQLGLQERALDLEQQGMEKDEAFRYAQLEQEARISQTQLQLTKMGMDRDEAFRYAQLNEDSRFRSLAMQLQAQGMKADQAFRQAEFEWRQQYGADELDLRREEVFNNQTFQLFAYLMQAMPFLDEETKKKIAERMGGGTLGPGGGQTSGPAGDAVTRWQTAQSQAGTFPPAFRDGFLRNAWDQATAAARAAGMSDNDIAQTFGPRP